MKAKLFSVIAGCLALSACIGDEPAARVPVVDEPLCEVPLPPTNQGAGIHERVSLDAAAGCNSTADFANDVVFSARRADGSIHEAHLVVERRVTAFVTGGECEIHLDMTAHERKLDELLEVAPVAAQVTLCSARVITSYADALSGAAPQLRSVRVGVDPNDGAAELTTLVAVPQAMPVEQASEVICGDAGDVSAHVERYAFHHRVVVRMSKEDALRLAWDGAIEVAFDVLYE